MRQRRKGQPATDEEIILALNKHGGVVSRAARELGYATTTLKQKMYTNETLKKYRDGFQENLLDEAEKGLLEKCKEGNIQAIRFALSTLGRRRGYSERVELTGAKGKDLFPELTPVQKQLLETRGISASDLLNDFFAEIDARVDVGTNEGSVEDST